MAQNNTLPAPLPPALQLQRRRLSHNRVQAILEGGRERAESLGQSAPDASPRLQPLLYPSRRPSSPSGSASPREVTDDGEHGLVTVQPERRPSIDYQSTAEMSPATRRRPSQTMKLPGQEQGQPPPGANREEDGAARPRAQPPQPWWKRFFRYFISIELENKGSVARDHLALERTFLAWLRTSLSFASIGIAVTQLFRLNTSLSGEAESVRRLGKPLGATFLAFSILILLLGYNRYLQGQYWVIKGKFPASRGTIMAVSFIAFGVTLASLIVILAVQE